MKRTRLGLGVLLALGACRGGEPATPSTSPQGTGGPETAAQVSNEAASSTSAPGPYRSVPWNASHGTATVTGRVTFVGEPPVPAPIDMSADPKCEAGGAVDESLLVRDGGLANCIVSVSKGLERYRFGDGSGVVEMEQRGCRYLPHVVVLQAGQTLRIVNQDDTVHNVHLYSKRNGVSGRSRPPGAPFEQELSRKDKLFPIRCDMHSWMSAHAEVFDHPFFAVSDADGSFELPKLPAGTYTLTAEHETLGRQTTQVTVTEGGAATAGFVFEK